MVAFDGHGDRLRRFSRGPRWAGAAPPCGSFRAVKRDLDRVPPAALFHARNPVFSVFCCVPLCAPYLQLCA